ncbi:MAG TPA: NAD(P)-dependent oxidoreductase [Casimicrobiaceae bacterium]|nr:NAD(P)-dependent oxidoreductase [Casimicrobiaceae bacterium]
MSDAPAPEAFADADALESFMTAPSAALVADLQRAPGTLAVLGVGGKMGPTLARLAKRADPARRVIGVARFSEPRLRERLESQGVECVAADLLDPRALDALPDAENIVFMAGRKFGSAGDMPLTWAMNVLMPARVAQRYARSRIVAFSTGCVYPFVPVTGPGADEDLPVDPPGEYAWTCVGRERAFQHGSQAFGTPGRLFRLNYAIDMRYGVLHDIARKVLAGEPIDIAMGWCNVIWQGDANTLALRALAHCTTPTSPINVSGATFLRVRDVALAFGERFGRMPRFTGTEAPTAWLTDTRRAQALFGAPTVATAVMIDWTADWLRRGGASLGKPTHYEARDGRY